MDFRDSEPNAAPHKAVNVTSFQVRKQNEEMPKLWKSFLWQGFPTGNSVLCRWLKWRNAHDCPVKYGRFGGIHVRSAECGVIVRLFHDKRLNVITYETGG